MSDFFNISPDAYEFWTRSTVPTRPLSLEDIERGAELMRKQFARPYVELHSPRCPKWLTDGKRACRCGGAPFEALFEDELDRREADRIGEARWADDGGARP